MAPANPSRWRYWLLFGAIPALALLIAARQGYLNSYHHLSTWKGGGMGMFAGADSGINRFTRIYIELPDGSRQPVVRLTPVQERLLDRALWYPVKENFRELAWAVRRTNLIAADQKVPIYRVNADGKRTGPTGRSYYLLNAHGPRKDAQDADWALIIEYWEISFDNATRLANATLVESMAFSKGEL